MDLLPGSGIFHEHTPAFWLNLAAGVSLGYIAGRLRTFGTSLEGKGWVLGLSAVAGLVLGVTVFLIFSLLVLMANTRVPGRGVGQLVVMSLLAQLLIFAVLVLRRGRQ